MAHVRGSIVIHRPIEEVFDLLADQTNEPRYNPAMTHSEKVTDGPIGVGTRFHATMLRGGKPLAIDIEYTGYDRPHLLASRSTMAGSVAVGEVRLASIPEGTRFQWDWDVSLAGPARLLGPIVAIIGRRQERAIWTGLKAMLEDGAAGGAAGE
ncbi:MAG: SRPBCC family protein [Tetrasphaera sp.]